MFFSRHVGCQLASRIRIVRSAACEICPMRKSLAGGKIEALRQEGPVPEYPKLRGNLMQYQAGSINHEIQRARMVLGTDHVGARPTNRLRSDETCTDSNSAWVKSLPLTAYSTRSFCNNALSAVAIVVTQGPNDRIFPHHGRFDPARLANLPVQNRALHRRLRRVCIRLHRRGQSEPQNWPRASSGARTAGVISR